MNQPGQQPDDFDPQKTVPDVASGQSHDNPQALDDLSATIVGGPEVPTDGGAEPPLDLGATMVIAPSGSYEEGSEGDLEDTLETQIGPPDPALLATALPAGTDDIDHSHLDSTQVWAQAPTPELEKTLTDSEKFLMEESEDGSNATMPGRLSNLPTSGCALRLHLVQARIPGLVREIPARHPLQVFRQHRESQAVDPHPVQDPRHPEALARVAGT